MKVLIIEDEHELAKSMVDYLSGQHYLCELATDYHQALEKIVAHQYDCILLDLMLPGGSGKIDREESGSNDQVIYRVRPIIHSPSVNDFPGSS